MPPKRDNPPVEDSIAALTESMAKLISTTTTSTEQLLHSQSSSQSQLEIIMKQLATQYDQNSSLIAAITKTERPIHQEVLDPKTPKTTGYETQIRPPKLFLPTFDGSNPLDWLFQAEQYFSFYQIPPNQRLTMVAFHLTGDALGWYKYLYHNKQLTTWETFTHALETRFGPSTYDNHQAALFKLRQTTTVTAYQTEFERLSNCIVGLPHEALLNCFVSGLRKDIQQDLTILRPTTVTQAIGLAKLIEDKNNDQRNRPRPYFSPRFTQPLPPSPPTPTPTTPSITPTIPPTSAPLLPNPTSRLTNTLPFTRLSPDALQKRRAAGLCFRCPEKYHPGHKCNPPQFLLIADNDDLTLSDSDIDDLQHSLIEPDPHTQPDAITTLSQPQFFSLSPAALLGLRSPKALRLTGYIAGHPVSVLIDCGSTHNIVQPRVAEFLHLDIEPITTFPVMTGSGAFLQCSGFSPSTEIHLQRHPFKVPFFILPVAGANIVLGMAWLSSLGPMLADFSIPQISFPIGTGTLTLKGESSTSQITSSNLHHLLQKDAVASLYTLTFDTPTNFPMQTQNTINHADPHIRQLLSTYSSLFDPPHTLPPPRPHDHHIPTIPTAPPVNVKPYRYPHFQKKIMTDLINEMLTDGLIKPSQSPYSSPVLLVRKKDGSWRFCVDYRALNAITIRDRFPIHTVDELLDDLLSATIFS